MGSERRDGAEPAPKRRRGRAKKVVAEAGSEAQQQEFKWREICVQLVQDGVNSLEEGICATCVAHRDQSLLHLFPRLARSGGMQQQRLGAVVGLLAILLPVATAPAGDCTPADCKSPQ
eukprot:COSAG02_NODE_148_length_33809_cov_158.369594_35_plen_118_part_00